MYNIVKKKFLFVCIFTEKNILVNRYFNQFFQRVAALFNLEKGGIKKNC